MNKYTLITASNHPLNVYHVADRRSALLENYPRSRSAIAGITSLGIPKLVTLENAFCIHMLVMNNQSYLMAKVDIAGLVFTVYVWFAELEHSVTGKINSST